MSVDYFQPVAYSFSGFVRVGRRGVWHVAERRITGGAWARIDGAEGRDLDRVFAQALACDPYARGGR